MSSVPTFLLKKLYVKRSLRNTATGFELAIQNTLAPGTIVGLAPLQIDGVEYPPEKIRVLLPNGSKLSPADVSTQSPMGFAVGDKVTIQVEGKPLPAGPHKLTISTKTKEAGTLQIPAEDTIA